LVSRKTRKHIGASEDLAAGKHVNLGFSTSGLLGHQRNSPF